MDRVSQNVIKYGTLYSCLSTRAIANRASRVRPYEGLATFNMAMKDREKTEKIGGSMGSTRFITGFKRATVVLIFPLKSIHIRDQTLNIRN